MTEGRDRRNVAGFAETTETRLTRRRLLGGAVGVGATASLMRFTNVGAQGEGAAGMTGGDPNFLLRAPEPNPQRGGRLRLAFNAATANYDLFQGGSFPVLCHLYNGLVREHLTEGLKTIVPDLATTWEVAPDGLSYTFTLRQGVTFHDGEPLTAHDVVATYSRIVTPPEGTTIIVRDRFPTLTAVEAVDDFTVRFTLSAPQATFLQMLTEPSMVVYSKKSLDENNGDLRRVIAPGTGPFTFVDYIEGEQWLFAKNPTYWNPELPYLDEFQIIHVPSWPDRGTAVLTGQADFSWNVGKDTWDEGANRPDEMKTHRVAAFGAYCVVINTQVEPFNDPRVRRAMHLVLDRPALIEVFARQEQIGASRWVPRTNQYATPPEVLQTLPGYRTEKEEDIATAQQLMAEAGYADGISGVDFLCASVPGHAELLGPAIQDQLLRALNIETTIRTQERSLMIEDQKAGNYTLNLNTIGSPISDFSPLANQTFKTGGSSNFMGYSNPEFDTLLQQSDQELDPTARGELIRKMEDILDQDSPILMIGYTDQLLMWNVRMHGLGLELRKHWENGRVETAWLEQS